MNDDRVDKLLESAEILLKQQKKDNAMHEKHHEFIEQMIEEKQARIAFWTAVTEKVVTGGIWAAICGVGAIVWYGITKWVHGG